MTDLTKECPKCGGKKLTEHVSGITRDVCYEDGYIVKEVNKYENSYEHRYVTYDSCCGIINEPNII